MKLDRGYVGQDISEKDSLQNDLSIYCGFILKPSIPILGAAPAQPTEKTSQGFVEFGCPDISATHRWLSKYCVTQPNFETQLGGKMFFFVFFRYLKLYRNMNMIWEWIGKHVNISMDSCIFFGIIKLEITESSGNQDALSTRMISWVF